MASMKGPEAAKATQANKAMWDRTGRAYDDWAVSGGLFKPISLVSQAAVSEAVQHNHEPVVLDLASASGEPAFTIASALPSAKVFCTDLSTTMVGLAAGRAQMHGLSNVTCQEADMQDLRDFADSSADAVICQLGYMFVPNTDRASQEISRVLKPGGTLVLAVWASQMTLLDIFTELRTRIAPDAPPLPITSDPRRFGDVSPLCASLASAGLTDIKHEEHEIPLRMAPDMFADFAMQFGPLGGYLASLPADEGAKKTAQARQLCVELMHEHGRDCGDGSVALPKNKYTIVTARKLR